MYQINEIKRYQAEGVTLLILKSNEDDETGYGWLIMDGDGLRIDADFGMTYINAIDEGIDAHIQATNLSPWQESYDTWQALYRVPTPPDPLLEAAKEAREYLGGIDSEAGTIDRICRDLDAAIKERDEA